MGSGFGSARRFTSAPLRDVARAAAAHPIDEDCDVLTHGIPVLDPIDEDCDVLTHGIPALDPIDEDCDVLTHGIPVLDQELIEGATAGVAAGAHGGSFEPRAFSEAWPDCVRRATSHKLCGDEAVLRESLEMRCWKVIERCSAVLNVRDTRAYRLPS